MFAYLLVLVLLLLWHAMSLLLWTASRMECGAGGGARHTIGPIILHARSGV